MDIKKKLAFSTLNCWHISELVGTNSMFVKGEKILSGKSLMLSYGDTIWLCILDLFLHLLSQLHDCVAAFNRTCTITLQNWGYRIGSMMNIVLSIYCILNLRFFLEPTVSRVMSMIFAAVTVFKCANCANYYQRSTLPSHYKDQQE